MTSAENDIPPRRKDAARTRELLLDAAGELISEVGHNFGLSDLARHAGVATPTVYRHFRDVPAVIDEYRSRLIIGLTTALQQVDPSASALERARQTCEIWVKEAESWGQAAVQTRPSGGVIERVRSGNELTRAVYDTLEPVVLALVEESQIPEQPTEYVVLMWFTLLDERLILDMRRSLGWSQDKTVDQLFDTLLATLRAPRASSREPD